MCTMVFCYLLLLKQAQTCCPVEWVTKVEVEVVTHQPLGLHDEVVLEEDEPDDGEQVDEDDGQHGCQQDGPPVPGDRLHDVDERLFSVDDVEE